MRKRSWSNLHEISQKIALPRRSLPKLILLSICAGFVIFPIVQSTTLRFVPFLPSFSAIFYEADDVHSGQKDFFQCIELRDLVDVQTKRDSTLVTKELLKRSTEVN